MTLEVYNTNSGIPMGKAQLGGGGAEFDGALYQYMGSVATYAALELLDTTNFKPGYVYDVQEDGMDYAWTGEAWNALGTHTDLSNYYTKSQTYAKSETYSKTEEDALLAQKQDKFTPAEPLSIGKIIYQQDAITVVGQYINYLQEISTAQFITDTSRSNSTVTIPTTQPGNSILDTSKAFYYVGDLKGLVVNTQNDRQNTGYCSFVIGRLEADNTFTPHIIVEPGNLAYFGSIVSTSGDTVQGINRTVYKLGTRTTAQSQGTGSYYGRYPQTVVTQLTTADSMTRILNDYRSDTGYLDHSYSYLTTPIAYEDWDDNCIIFAISTTKQRYLNDKFYITKNGSTIWTPSWSDEQTYLKLGIGAGLAVQNGNLVNTNPTPVDVSNKVTGVGISEMQALTQTEYDEIGKYYAYEYNGTTVYVRKETPTTTDTVYSAIDTASALTITSVGTDSLTLSDSNTYTRSAASDEVDDTQYDATILYVVKNVVGE